MDDAALSFEWKLQGHGQHETLGNTMILDTVINVPMNREAYSLLYTVTDTENELTVTKRYYLYVDVYKRQGKIVNAWHIAAKHELFSWAFNMELENMNRK